MQQRQSARTGSARSASTRVSRRNFLAGLGAVAGAGALAACGSNVPSPAPRAIGPGDPAVVAAEAARRRPGARVRDYALTPRATTLDLGGPRVATWAYGESATGPLIRATAGEVLRVRVDNQLPTDNPDQGATTVHWHGIALRNDMDGVPALTQNPLVSARSQIYEFTAPDPGTYWYHPHVGVQFDRALQGPLIIDDPREPGRYDVEFVVVLDDWLDGVGGATPDRQLSTLQRTGMRMDMGGGTSPAPGTDSVQAPSAVGDDGGDVDYPYYLINGRVADAPAVLTARPGQRARIRVINVGGDTAFRIALGGHRITVTDTDGFPVRPVTGDSVLLGQAERVDLAVTLDDGAFPLVASAEGKAGGAQAVVRTSPLAAAPPVGARPAELDGRLLTVADFRAAEQVAVPERTPDRVHDVALGGDMARYLWTLNGRTFDQHQPLPVRTGERVRLTFRNTTSMFHPMHLHGHTFTVRTGGAEPGPRKDTVIVLPDQTVTVDFDADNPGQWATHCHNIYHEAAGMMTNVSYQA